MARGGALGALAAALLLSAAPLNVARAAGDRPGDSAPAVPEVGIPQRMRLMTRDQYVNTLHYIFGPDLRVDARFPPMTRVQGLLESGAAVAGVTDSQTEQYQRTAALVAAEVVDAQHRDFLVPCKPKDEHAADGACAKQFLGRVGTLLYRRTLSGEELAQLVSEADRSADQLKGFYPGLAITLESILMSPQVLLITDTYEPDPQRRGEFRLDSYSLAQRLSFFLWNAAPDDALLKAAETHAIQNTKERERIVDMMLASPRLEVGMRAFFDDMFGFEDFDTLSKDAKVYPTFTGVTVMDAREQTLRTVVNHLITEKRDYRDLFTTRETFISPALAALYGVPAGQGWIRYDFPADSARAGILTHISFLALHAHPGRSSPTRRGKALREIFLCQKVPNPPANVDFSALENPRADQHTQRDRVSFHLHNPVCAGCHRITDPIGLSMELFDGAGVYRASEHGASIDASGTLDGKSFPDTVGLAHALHDHPVLTSCLVQRLYAYGSGGPTTPEDKPLLSDLNQRFAAEGYRLPDLLRTIVLSPTFTQVRPEAVDEGGAAKQTTARVQ
jgi:hypothetical protein